MNQFFDLQGRGIDRTHVYLIPCTFGTFKKTYLLSDVTLKGITYWSFHFLYLRFSRSPFYNINDYKFILGYIFISRKFILIFLQLRLVRNRINHPKVTQFPIIIKHNICMPAIRTPTSIRRNFTILPRILLTSIRKIRDSVRSQLHFRSIYSQCLVALHTSYGLSHTVCTSYPEKNSSMNISARHLCHLPFSPPPLSICG